MLDVNKDFFTEALAESQTETPTEQPSSDVPEATETVPTVEAEVEPSAQPDAPTTEATAETTETPTETKSVETTPDVEAPTNITIDGKEYSIDEIKQWQLGNMRQSDYTKKTQELAALREELNKTAATEQTTQDTVKDEPVNSELQELKVKVSAMELDKEISNLKTKYSDFNEVDVLNKANELGITDLETAYKAIRPDVDVDAIRAEAIAQAKAELMAEIEANKSATTETVIKAEAQKEIKQTKSKYSEGQARLAKLMNVSLEDMAD